MRKVLAAAAVAALAMPTAASAQATGSAQSPLVGSTRALYEQTRDFIMRSAEQVPEQDYAFRPTEEVRTFGELLGHIANAQYMICSIALGEQSPSRENIEQTRTTKAQLIDALRASFEYCDRAYATVTDAQAAEQVTLFGAQRTKMYALTLNVAHDMEHYGNIVTYMRIRGMVPPSSQRGD